MGNTNCLTCKSCEKIKMFELDLSLQDDKAYMSNSNDKKTLIYKKGNLNQAYIFNKRHYSQKSLYKIIQIQAWIRGYLLRKKIRIRYQNIQNNKQKSNKNNNRLMPNQVNHTRTGSSTLLYHNGSSISSNNFMTASFRTPTNNLSFSPSTINNAKREKRPPFQFENGIVYEGEWISNVRDGYGVQVWPDGAKYEGDWKNNKTNGKGKFYHIDGDTFTGHWKDDKANGYGVYLHANGAKYEGEWVDDLQHGYGVELWSDKSKYEGYYYEGKKHGKGTYTWADGAYYTGDWDNNKISGYGIYFWLDGRKYEGQWLDNNMHGKGIFTWPDGRKYEGEFRNDKKEGYGIYTYPDGRRYEGYWMNDKQHNKSKYTDKDGRVRWGIWENGKRVRWLDEDVRALGTNQQKVSLVNAMKANVNA